MGPGIATEGRRAQQTLERSYKIMQRGGGMPALGRVRTCASSSTFELLLSPTNQRRAKGPIFSNEVDEIDLLFELFGLVRYRSCTCSRSAHRRPAPSSPCIPPGGPACSCCWPRSRCGGRFRVGSCREAP